MAKATTTVKAVKTVNQVQTLIQRLHPNPPVQILSRARILGLFLLLILDLGFRYGALGKHFLFNLMEMGFLKSLLFLPDNFSLDVSLAGELEPIFSAQGSYSNKKSANSFFHPYTGATGVDILAS